MIELGRSKLLKNKWIIKLDGNFWKWKPYGTRTIEIEALWDHMIKNLKFYQIT